MLLTHLCVEVTSLCHPGSINQPGSDQFHTSRECCEPESPKPLEIGDGISMCLKEVLIEFLLLNSMTQLNSILTTEARKCGF